LGFIPPFDPVQFVAGMNLRQSSVTLCCDPAHIPDGRTLLDLFLM
jgi:hypothetical protein